MMLSDDARALWNAALNLKETRGLDAAACSVSQQGRDLPPLLFFTDPARTPRPWETVARMPPGSAVVYRHFGAEDARSVAETLRRVTHDRSMLLLIGQDAELADQVGADGVHLPEHALSMAPVLRRRRADWLITAAVHSLNAVAAVQGTDALVLSPIFPAGGASGSKPALGIGVLRQAVITAPCQVYALGGIGPGTLDALAGTGACGIAAVEAIASAFGDPRI